MKVWVKGIDYQKVKMWMRKDILVQMFESWDAVSYDDIIFVSKNDEEEKPDEYMVLIWEEYFDKVLNNVGEDYRKRYDYYYLKRQIERAKSDMNIDTIITGSSYGLLGIDENLLENEINCSLQSQDLYYSVKSIMDICSENNNIKNIVICCNYYYFYSDLSRTQNIDEIQRVSNVYEPLFGDLHNCVCLLPGEEVLVKSNIFDIEKIRECYMYSMPANYFNEKKTRATIATRLWGDIRSWKELSNEEKEECGKVRAQLHNKNIKRTSTCMQNVKMFFDFARYCNGKKNIIFVVTPTTQYYRKNLLDEYKAVFYQVLNEADCELHLLDLSDDENYTDEDFNDMDHLGDSGATKMTQTIQELIREIN